MRLKKWTRPDHRKERRLSLIVDLGRRRDRLLESPELDLDMYIFMEASIWPDEIRRRKSEYNCSR